ncbi:MAG: hypothetical protein EOO88_32695 [Pedobacter sp.]|nr:MAG: hypothetical protein EOO88_32695 [Pedobacter sp.]
MKFFYICLLQLIAVPPLVWGQQSYTGNGEYTHTINFTDRKVIFHLREGLQEKVTSQPGLRYYWYSSNQINVTQGGSGGRLLEGDYKEFYLNKNLKVKAYFKKGLKEGQWSEWAEDGTLQLQAHYIRGHLHGLYSRYGAEGILAEQGTYSKGKKQGTWRTYGPNDSISVTRYRDGLIKLENDFGPLTWIKKKMGWSKAKRNAERSSNTVVSQEGSGFFHKNGDKSALKIKPN